MNIIEISNLVKYYKDNLILNNINYNFIYNQTYLLVGANGSGKSTLIKIILSFVKATSGKASLYEKRIGYIPERAIFPEMISINDFLFNLALIRKIDNKKAPIIINQLLEEWNLDGIKRMDKLSKGMLQKVLIIQAFIHDPALYIFDEPLNGLDFKSQAKFINLIKQLQLQKKTIIIVTHYKDYYQNLVDHIIYINNGGFDEESI